MLFHFFTEVDRVKVKAMNTGKVAMNSGIENILYKRGCRKIEGCLKKKMIINFSPKNEKIY